MTFIIYHYYNKILQKKQLNDMQLKFEDNNNEKYKIDSI